MCNHRRKRKALVSRWGSHFSNMPGCITPYTQQLKVATMSITDSKTIDMWGIPKSSPNKVILGIADHLSWSKTKEGEHLLKLQEKLNTYISFIESGEIYSAIPSSKGASPTIRLIGNFPLSTQGEMFIERATAILQESGI